MTATQSSSPHSGLTWPTRLGLVTVCLVVSVICWRLGLWQFHRYQDHRAANSHMQQQLAQPESPIEQLLTPDLGPASSVDQTAALHQAAWNWRAVSAQGHFLPQTILLWRNRTSHSAVGFNLVAAVRADSGLVVLVDCGWLPRDSDIPTLPAGQVQVRGWLRNDQSAAGVDLGWSPAQSAATGDTPPRSARHSQGLALPSFSGLDLEAISAQVGVPLAPAVLQAHTLHPGVPTLTPVEDPGQQELSTTRHVTYAWQWWLFALGTPVGFFMLARRTARQS